MLNHRTTTTALFLALTLASSNAHAGGDLVGDPINGKKLYLKECAACHGDDARGGRTGVALTDSGRTNLILNDHMFEMIQVGKHLKKADGHAFRAKLDFLQTWDAIAHVRSVHMTLADFFPDSSRYLSKVYTIDQHGLDRIKERAGVSLTGDNQTAAVFTFFNFEGEEGNLMYVPQDPIKLDQLKKNLKAGYLVFLPFRADGFDGEIGVAMDPGGVITKLAVHPGAKGADLLNKSLSRFVGMGKKNQIEPFKVSGGKQMDDLAKAVFPIYMRAMETVTMYDREEIERTWADDH